VVLEDITSSPPTIVGSPFITDQPMGDAHDEERREREGGASDDQEGTRSGVARLKLASKKMNACTMTSGQSFF
jgi:hypothetical protein